MFVPSLSWQNDRFMYKLLKKGGFGREGMTTLKASAAAKDTLVFFTSGA